MLKSWLSICNVLSEASVGSFHVSVGLCFLRLVHCLCSAPALHSGVHSFGLAQVPNLGFRPVKMSVAVMETWEMSLLCFFINCIWCISFYESYPLLYWCLFNITVFLVFCALTISWEIFKSQYMLSQGFQRMIHITNLLL